MAYTSDMRSAAKRHYDDGVKLFAAKCYDNAGYHFGFAAECAVKQKLMDAGVRGDDDSIWKHWPTLRRLGMLAIAGRTGDPIRRLLQADSFMQEWDTKMRYAASGSVTDAIAEKWRLDADRALGLLI
jgi:hypothetical protein